MGDEKRDDADDCPAADGSERVMRNAAKRLMEDSGGYRKAHGDPRQRHSERLRQQHQQQSAHAAGAVGEGEGSKDSKGSVAEFIPPGGGEQAWPRPCLIGTEIFVSAFFTC